MSEKDDGSDGESGISSGWVVCRSLTQFQELHKKLRPLCSDVRSLDLPSSTFKFLFGKTDRASLDKAKTQIQKYLNVRESNITLICSLNLHNISVCVKK